MPASRIVQVNQVAVDQADLFEADGITRVQGLLPQDLTHQIFCNNQLQPWPLIDGTGVPDALVRANVYWCEIVGAPGVYSVRFRPNSMGYWRLLVTYGPQILGQDFDVVAQETTGGIKASFVRV